MRRNGHRDHIDYVAVSIVCEKRLLNLRQGRPFSDRGHCVGRCSRIYRDQVVRDEMTERMKFNEWFDLSDQTKEPEVRRLCEIAYNAGYEQVESVNPVEAA